MSPIEDQGARSSEARGGRRTMYFRSRSATVAWHLFSYNIYMCVYWQRRGDVGNGGRRRQWGCAERRVIGKRREAEVRARLRVFRQVRGTRARACIDELYFFETGAGERERAVEIFIGWRVEDKSFSSIYGENLVECSRFYFCADPVYLYIEKLRCLNFLERCRRFCILVICN